MVDDRSNDKLTLEINGVNFGEIKEYTLRKDVLQGCGAFEAEINPLRHVSVCHEPLLYKIKIGNRLYQTGWLDTTSRHANKTTHNYHISGRDVCQLWIDNYLLKSHNFSGVPFQQIINTTLSDSASVSCCGKTLRLNDAITPTITSEAQEQAASLIKGIHNITSEPGQTIFEFLGRLCNQLGLIIYSSEDGRIVIDTLLRDDAGKNPFQAINKTNDRGNNNITEIEFHESAVAYHAYKKIQGQVSAPLLDESGEALSFKNRKIDARRRIEHLDTSFLGLTRFRTVKLFETDGVSWTAGAEKLLRSVSTKEARELFALHLTFHGHAQSEPYDINRNIYVDDDLTGLRGTWVIYGVEMRGSKTEGYSTRLECHTKSRTDSEAMVYTNDSGQTQRIYAEDTQPFAEMYDTIKSKEYRLREGAKL